MTGRELTFKDQLRGFPLWQIFVISFARLAEPITFTSLFPYVYFMVRDFHIAKSESDVSRYVGYLSSTFALFEFLFSVQFGVFLEKYGRKVVLVIGLISMAISILLFGFSRNYWQAVVARSLMGASNGFCSVVRTVVGEIAVKKRHQAVLFSTLPLGWCIGSVIGPLIPSISSSLYPNTHSPDPKDSNLYKIVSKVVSVGVVDKLVEKFPYCLSNIIIAIFLLFSAALLFLFLDETHPDMKNDRDIGIEIGDLLRNLLRLPAKTRPWKTDGLDEDSVLLIEGSEISDYATIEPQLSKDSSKSSDSDTEFTGPISRRLSTAMIEHYSSRNNSFSEYKTHSNLESLLLPQTFNTLLSSFLISAHCLIFDEFLPVFLSLDIVREIPDDPNSRLVSRFPFKIVGGLQYTTSQVGNALAFTGVIGVLVLLFVFPYLDRKYSSVSVYRLVLQVFPISYFLLPYLIFTVPPNKFTDSTSLSTLSVYSLFLLKTFGQSNAFPEIMLLVHRASPPKNRAFINGVLMSSTAFSRFFGLLIWGIIMSWSNARDIGWLTWWSLGAIALIGSVQCFLINIPDDDDEDDED